MEDMAELERCADELATAAKSLAADWRRTELSRFALGDGPYPNLPTSAPEHMRQAQRSVLANAWKIQLTLSHPADFLQRLAHQNQILACLQWLCVYDVLTCIPLDGSLPLRDLADISGAPEAHLRRVIGLLSQTAGFLHENVDGSISHSPLSAQFASQPSLLDATEFLGEVAAPAALKMAEATRRFPGSDRPDQTAFNVALHTTDTFASRFGKSAKLQRQLAASLSYGSSDEEAGFQDLLMRVDWSSLGKAIVVHVGAQSTSAAISLVRRYPALRVIVQTYGPEPSNIVRSPSAGRLDSIASMIGHENGSLSTEPTPAELPLQANRGITVQQRAPGSSQAVQDAALYILRLPTASPGSSLSTTVSRVVSELNAHVEVLRANPGSRLMLTAAALSSPGTVEVETETAARLRDMSLLQLLGTRLIERGELLDIVNDVRDKSGRLIMTNEIRAEPSCPLVAFEVKYQGYTDPKF